MIKLVAMLRDGHSRLTLPVGPAADTQSHTPTAAPKTGMAFHILPFRLYLFSDGLYVQAATPEHRDLVGARIVRIGTMTAEAALEAVRPAVHYDSEMWLKLVGPQFLGVPEILQACGITEAVATDAPDPGEGRADDDRRPRAAARLSRSGLGRLE